MEFFTHFVLFVLFSGVYYVIGHLLDTFFENEKFSIFFDGFPILVFTTQNTTYASSYDRIRQNGKLLWPFKLFFWIGFTLGEIIYMKKINGDEDAIFASWLCKE